MGNDFLAYLSVHPSS